MVFGRKKKPAFVPPELPLSDVQRRKSSAVSGPSRRRSSIFPSMPSLFQSETDGEGFTRASFSGSQPGRKFSVVPSFARKASEMSDSVSRARRGTGHVLYGESDRFADKLNIDDAFYRSRLTIDDSDDEDLETRDAALRDLNTLDVKGKGRAGWQSNLGWETAPPKGSRRRGKKAAAAGKKVNRRSKRVVRDLDNDLDAFNNYAQNGQAPLRTMSRRNSLTSLQPSLAGELEQHSPGLLDGVELYKSEKPKAVLVGDGYDAIDVMADQIFRVGVQKKKWFKPPRLGLSKRDVATGVTIRVKTGLYRTFPVEYEALEPFEKAISRLNPEAAIKIKSRIVSNVMAVYIKPTPSMTELIIDSNTRIQIIDDVEHLARARKHQYAAFVRSEEVLVVWADHVEMVIPAAEALEEALIDFVWRGEEANKKVNQAMIIQEEEEKAQVDENGEVVKDEDLDPEDVTMRKMKRHWRERPVMLWAPVSDGFAIMLVIVLIGFGLRTLVKEAALDGQYVRFSLMVFAPALVCIAAFACNCVVGSFFQILGPIRQVTQNSKYYSGVAPKRTMGELAHVTVQLPVYKESLQEVIMPTIASLKKAITTYERQGGSVGILVCDDGLQLLSQEEADERRQFYFNNSIAYVARPGHNQDGFIRKGRFKKAGNMNFTIRLSLRVEEIMDDLRPDAQAELGAEHYWCDLDENALYDTALAQAVEESKGQAWAAGNIRMGAIILIIDSDTRVPEDCFADAVSEMAESPEVAIIQHMSGVMQVANHFFENGIAHFTRGIQHAISYCAASGEVAPFVGHNAFLRWEALQECLHIDPDDGDLKIWSEDHVSEDFQIAITLQGKGYDLRWASYSNGEFEEGVSLTCDDELNRWQKYAFGCSELLFHPLKKIFTKGPLTPLIRSFAWSPIPLHSKFSILGYIFSYYAIACSWSLTCVNFFIVGFNLPLDGYYLPSWNVFLVCVIIFVGLCNVAFITLRYRLKLPGASKMATDQLKWIPFFSIFFTGMSMPMSAALVSHIVGYNMTWSTTVKTVEKSNFFLQIPIIWKRFYPQLVFFTLMVGAMIATSLSSFPDGYRIISIEVIVPMAVVAASHLLWPFALNPWFLSFSF